LYIREDDDLVVTAPMPIVLRRTYLSGDRRSRQFGVGTTHPGEWYLHGDGDPRVSWAELILENGARIHFDRISSGDSQANAVLWHDSTPTEFNGSYLGWDGTQWALRFRDGALAFFQDCQGPTDRCSLLDQWDSKGNHLTYTRDAAGRLVKMESGNQSITLDYDDHRRIVAAHDTQGRSVTYGYDEGGRLTRTTGWDRIVRAYAYNSKDELIGVQEPGRAIENAFDESGRLANQIVRWPDGDEPYTASLTYVVEGGAVVQTDFTENGFRTRYRFNKHHYILSSTVDVGEPSQVTVNYNRNETTSFSSDVTISCAGPEGAVTRTTPLPAGLSPLLEDPIQEELIRQQCVTRDR